MQGSDQQTASTSKSRVSKKHKLDDSKYWMPTRELDEEEK